MPNYFSDNPDILFHFDRLDLREVVAIAEDDYAFAQDYEHAPRNYEDARESYRRVLEVVGDIAGNRIAPRATSVDEEGATFADGKVTYAEGTRENLKDLAQADLMGMILPHRFGGLNFPFSVYGAAVEIVSRADASLMNIFGLQDIADCIVKFGTEEQCKKYLPRFCSGEFTGAMALTEPDAGSDLQAVKLRAYQTEDGEWRLEGVKRFITNGNGQVLLVLARTEPGSKDARGLSMFVCRGDDTVLVRRIENKLGIHGSPTCELQFRHTPAELVGKRRLGLIKYVLDLMYRARLGVSAQAMGIAQQAYEEALTYAQQRIQFGKPISEIPAVTNMLVEMRVKLEAMRTLLYFTGEAVDLKEKLEEKVARGSERGQRDADISTRAKEAHKIAGILTPLTKYVVTEGSNEIAYDALQIHGGAGYMREFRIERLARDARITNIYEGTSQLQIVAATGGVVTDVLGGFFAEHAAREYPAALAHLAGRVAEMRQLGLDCLARVVSRKDGAYLEVVARHLVEMYGCCLIGYLLLDHAQSNTHKAFIAKRYILGASALCKRHAETIESEVHADLLHAREILI